MLETPIIGTYYKTEENAINALRNRLRIDRKLKYVILSAPKFKGVILVAGQQLFHLNEKIKKDEQR